MSSPGGSPLRYLLALTELALLLALPVDSDSFAQEQPAHLRFVRHVQNDDFGVTHPGAVTFSPWANAFLVLPTSGAAQPPAGTTTIAMFNEIGEHDGRFQFCRAVTEFAADINVGAEREVMPVPFDARQWQQADAFGFFDGLWDQVAGQFFSMHGEPPGMD